MSLATPALPEEAARPWAEPGSDLARRYRSAGARDWRDFLNLLRLETDFTPVLLTVPDESGADVLRRWLGESLAARGNPRPHARRAAPARPARTGAGGPARRIGARAVGRRRGGRS